VAAVEGVKMDEDELREYEEDARKHGIPYMLDRMGLDGIGNDVNDLHKRILELEAEVAAFQKLNLTLMAQGRHCYNCNLFATGECDWIPNIVDHNIGWDRSKGFYCSEWAARALENQVITVKILTLEQVKQAGLPAFLRSVNDDGVEAQVDYRPEGHPTFTIRTFSMQQDGEVEATDWEAPDKNPAFKAPADGWVHLGCCACEFCQP
jgi:hypothetical protein